MNNIHSYYVTDINIAYRRVHSLKFRGIRQELSEIWHFKDKVVINNNSKHILNRSAPTGAWRSRRWSIWNVYRQLLLINTQNHSILDGFPWILNCIGECTFQDSREYIKNWVGYNISKICVLVIIVYTFRIDQRRERQAPVGADLFKTCLLLLLMNTLSLKCHISLNSWRIPLNFKLCTLLYAILMPRT